MKKLFLVLCGILLATTVFGQATIKVGYVNMNKAINLSSEGKRSKQFLEVQVRRTQATLQEKEKELKQKEADLNNNIMLNQEAKEQKRQELIQLQQEFRKEVADAQNSMRQDEIRHTTKIFKDLVLVIKDIAKEEGFDLVLEFNVQQTILYSKYEMIELTDKVTERYDRMQSGQ